jgi:phosphatidylserine/phosphatidylglycerophosphate/cardiolipin synthase-like enzyme
MAMQGSAFAEPVLITSSKAYADFVMTQVRQALHEILIDTCTLEFDGFGQPLLSELEYACQRGLQVRCLIDASGSKNFIEDHPALFTQLETEIRVRDASTSPGNFVVFDGRLAVTGNHALRETSADDHAGAALMSSIVTGEAAAEIAARITRDWQQASPRR